jgi:hypothetical protein
VTEFETSGLRRSEFCHEHNWAFGTLQRGLKRRRMEVDGQTESKRLVEVKMAGIDLSAFTHVSRVVASSPSCAAAPDP